MSTYVHVGSVLSERVAGLDLHLAQVRGPSASGMDSGSAMAGLGWRA